MAVSIADIKKLRELTGAGMSDCKKALEVAEGDFEKAVEEIRKKGQAVAAKREAREAEEGTVVAAAEGEFAAIIALKCETDFVATNDRFVGLANKILALVMANKPKSIDEVLALPTEEGTVKDSIVAQIGVTGEKMELGAYEYINGVSTVAYNHMNHKLSTIVAFNQTGVDEHVAKDVAMQAAAMNPIATTREEIPADVVARELEIGKEKAREEGKPEAMLEKIAQGRLGKFYKESALVEQEFIKDAKTSVAQYMAAASKGLTATGFKRVNLNAD
jgi:elongation factor Ts